MRPNNDRVVEMDLFAGLRRHNEAMQLPRTYDVRSTNVPQRLKNSNCYCLLTSSGLRLWYNPLATSGGKDVGI